MQSLRGSLENPGVSDIREDEEECLERSESRIMTPSNFNNPPTALQNGFQRTFGKDVDLNIDELNSSLQD